MTYPKYITEGVGTGGGGTTHTVADLAKLIQIGSPLAELFVLVVTLNELAAYAGSIRDQQPAAFKAASAALNALTGKVGQISTRIAGME